MPGPGDSSSSVGAYDRIAGQYRTRSSWSSGNSQTFRADPEKGFKNLYVHAKKSRWTFSSQYRANRREKKIAGAQVMKDALDKQFGLGAGEKVFRHIQSRSFRGHRNLDQEVTRGDLHRINDALAKLQFRSSYKKHGSPKLPDVPKTFVKYVERMQRTGRMRVDGTQVFKLIEQDYGSDMAETLFSSILGVDVKTGQTPRTRLKPADVMKMQQDLLGKDPFSKLFQQRLGSRAGDNVYLSYDVGTRQFADDRPDVARDELDPAVGRRRRAAGTKIWRMLRNEVGVRAADKIFTDVFDHPSGRNVPVTYGDLDEIYAHLQAEKLQRAGHGKVDSKSLQNCYRMMIAFVTSGVIDRQRYHDYECLMRLSPERAAKALIQETEAVGNSQGNAPKPPDMIEQLMVAHAAKADQAAGTLHSAYSEGWRRTQQNGLARACAEIVMDRNGKFSRERARQVVSMLATGNVPGTLIPGTDKMSDHTRHIIRILTLMCDNRSFRKTLDGIGAPIGQDNPAQDIVRKTLGLLADAEITEIHARQAALSALLGNIRQAKTGSCFATSLAIHTIKNDPSRTLSELKQLIETGKMTVLSIMNNTRWKVPISRGTSTDEVKQSIRLDGDGMLVQASRRKVLKEIPFHEMPPVTAALTAMGIPKREHEAAVKAACADYAGKLTTPEEILRRVAMARHGLALDHFEVLEQIRDLQHQAQEADRNGEKDDAQKYKDQLNKVTIGLHMRTLEEAVESEAFGDSVREDARRAIEQDIRDEIEWDGKDDIKDDIKQDSKEDIGQAKKNLFDLKVQQIALSNGRTVAKYRGEYYLLGNKNLEDGVEIKGPLRVKSLLRTEDVNAANDMARRGIDGFEAAVDNRLLRAWEYTIADLMLQGDKEHRIEDRPVAGLGGDKRDWKSVAPEKDLPLLPFMERQFFVWKKQSRSLENQLKGLTDDPDRPKPDKTDYGRFITGWDRSRYAKDMPLTDEGVFLAKFQDRVATDFLSSLEERFVSVYEADEDFGQESGFTLYDTRKSSRREDWRRIDSQEAYLALAASLLQDAARRVVAEMGGVGKLPDDVEKYLSKVVKRTVDHVLRPEHAEVVRKAVDRYDTRIGAVCENLPWEKTPGGWSDIYQKYTHRFSPKSIGTLVDINTPAEDRNKRAQVLCQDLALFLISNRQTYARLQKSRDTNIQLHALSPNHGFNIGLQMQGAVRNAGAIADAWKFDERDVRKAILGDQASREIAAKAYADIVADGRIDEDMKFRDLSVDQVVDKVCRAHWRAAAQKSSFRKAMVKRAQAHIWMSRTLITPGRALARTEMSVSDQRALVTRMLPDLGLPDRNNPIAQDLLNAITTAQTPPQLAKQVVETLQANKDYAERQQREDPDWADRVPANLVCWTKEPPPHVIVGDYNHEANGFAIFVAFVYNPFIDAVESRMIDEGGNIGALGKNHYDPTSRGIWTISDDQPTVY